MASLEELLQTTSRTFALAIPLLPEPERLEVTLGYLVFRIADTLEDGENLSRDERIASLREFSALLGGSLDDVEQLQRFAAKWAARHPADDEHYQQLLVQTPDVLTALADRSLEVRSTIVKHAQRSIAGMIETLRRADGDGSLACESIGELREYCYHVAGIVGELLTELFEMRLDKGDSGESLRLDARWFGEGLQLVNILKDADADAQAGRRYLPQRAPLDEVFTIASEDLSRAARYIDALRQAQAPAGYIAFTRAPRELAVATLAKLRADGPGAKLTRLEVGKILSDIAAELEPDGDGPTRAARALQSDCVT